MTVLGEIRKTIVDTFHEITVHGFIFLVKRGTHLIERLVWLVCIGIGIYGILSLGLNTWNRYQTNPTVISMDRNKFEWNTSFPTREFTVETLIVSRFVKSCIFLVKAVTVCPEKRIDENKLNGKSLFAKYN